MSDLFFNSRLFSFPHALTISSIFSCDMAYFWNLYLELNTTWNEIHTDNFFHSNPIDTMRFFFFEKKTISDFVLSLSIKELFQFCLKIVLNAINFSP